MRTARGARGIRMPPATYIQAMHFATLTVTYQTEHNLGTALELHITIELVTHAWSAAWSS